MRVESEENAANRLYVFKTTNFNTSPETDYIAVGTKPISLWHLRCGLLGYPNLATLVSRGRALGLQIAKRVLADFPVCDVCERSDQQRASFKNTFTRHASQVNELFFTDIKGPIEVPSVGQKRRALVFVDDFSGFVTTHLLVHKSEALCG
jgi:hypothetical protein